MVDRFIEILRQELHKQINDEYTEYKIQKLKEFDWELESLRNEKVKNILDSINIATSQDHMGTNIMIKIENKVILKKE